VSGGTIVGSQFEVYAPLERVTIVTALGIRFWDALLDAPVRDGLDVTARPLGQRAGGTVAFRTASGIYAFRGLPGLHDVEYPAGDALASPLKRRRLQRGGASIFPNTVDFSKHDGAITIAVVTRPRTRHTEAHCCVMPTA